jgi:hypothetical protein
VIALVAVLAACVLLLAGLLAWQRRTPAALRSPHGGRRILIPFTRSLDPTVLNAAIRIARAEDAVLVPAYLLVVPLEYAESSPVADQLTVAMPLLEAVEHAAYRAGVAVDARIEKGRSATHALRRLWQVERFDRVVAPAPADRGAGFSAKDLSWILTNSPTETVVLKPPPGELPEPGANGASSAG